MRSASPWFLLVVAIAGCGRQGVIAADGGPDAANASDALVAPDDADAGDALDASEANDASDVVDAGDSASDATAADAADAGAGADATLDAGPWTLGAPFATSAPPFPVVSHPLAPTSLWADTTPPLPTNVEWQALTLGDGHSPFQLFPYVIDALDDGFEVSVPTRTATGYSVELAMGHDLTLSSSRPLSGRVQIAHDLFGATMRWRAATSGTMTASFVHGMAMATAVYDGLPPQLRSRHGITSINGTTQSPVTSDRLVLALDNQTTWVVYTDTPATWTFAGSVATATTPLTGAVRAAFVPPVADALAVLDAHRGAYVTGGDLAATVTGDTATVQFRWAKAGTGPLLMMAMQHHLDDLVAPSLTDVAIPTLLGDVVGVSGDAWTQSLALSPITWTARQSIDPARAPDVAAALKTDAATQAPQATDPYFYGKEIAKLGRLALIADELGDAASAATVRARMKSSLAPWLAGQGPDPLRYDGTWGGVVSTHGLADPGADFGQGYYNDHVFHYGYFLYAAAALGKGDATWLASNRDALIALARDIANPSTADRHFTRFRHMDWYVGHSWATGLFQFGDTHNEESTSEAVNGWYGLSLLGRALGDENLQNVGRVLLASELAAARKYWHIRSADTIYDPAFVTHKVVGRVCSLRAVYDTFFGSNPEYIHGIQMLPFTPISEELLDRDWVAEEWPVVSAALTAATSEGWRGFIDMDGAVIDRDRAWAAITSRTAFDDGNSRTNALYWVATRP